jgi:hypothetical protein
MPAPRLTPSDLGIPPSENEMLAQMYRQREIASYRQSAALQFAMMLSKDALDDDGPSPATIIKKAKQLADELTQALYPDDAAG